MKLEKKLEQVKSFLIKRDGEYCTKCKSQNELTIDHIIPVSFLEAMGIKRQYTYSIKVHGNNLQLLCRKCNVLKSFRFDWGDKRTRPLINFYLDNIDNDLSPSKEEIEELKLIV